MEMTLELLRKSVLTILMMSMLTSLAIGQTWEVYDEDYKLVRKIENEKINILGNAVRVSTTEGTLNLLGKDYETILSIDNAKVFQYLEPWIIDRKSTRRNVHHVRITYAG